MCVNANKLSKDFVGRVIDDSFINDLPDDVDLCGENGEFHTFCYDGPIFKHPIDFELGEKVLKSYELKEHSDDNCYQNSEKEEEKTRTLAPNFWYCDLHLKA